MTDGLVQLSFLVQSVLSRAAADNELTVPQVRLLGILRDREPGMMQLAKYLGLDKSSVTGLIDRAERRGLVRRASSSEDGRAVHVCATALGSQLTEQVSADIEHQMQDLVDELDESDRQILTKLLRRIVFSNGTLAAGGRGHGPADQRSTPADV